MDTFSAVANPRLLPSAQGAARDAAQDAAMKPGHLREARRLLGWSADRLASLCEIGPHVIWGFEREGRVVLPLRPASEMDRLGRVQAALELAGIEFVGDGVRLRASCAGAEPPGRTMALVPANT